jgi:hypothetical protein
MSRLLHIFRKDIRHFWKEVLLSWCLLGLYVWQAGQKWNTAHRAYGLHAVAGGAILGAASGLTGFLLVLSWWVLIVRLVQDERLVGDRQFWLTRPYRWAELLASKIIFVLLFIHLPLLVAQLAILNFAGFAPGPYLSGLFYLHAGLLVVTAAVFTIATVTATLVQTILAAFVVLLYGVGNSGVISSVPNSSMPHLQNPWDPVESLILLCAIIGVILLQYARRKSGVSRGIIIGLAVLSTIIGVITPYERLIAKTYPPVSSVQNSALQVVLDTRKPEKPSTPPRFNRIPVKPREEKIVEVAIPLLASAASSDELIQINGIRVSVDSFVKREWESNWFPYTSVIVLPETGILASFEMPKSVFESLKSEPVKANIEFALSVFRKGNERWHVVAQDDDFPVPGLGLCSMENTLEMRACRSPLHGPLPVLATTNSLESTCEVSNNETPVPEFTGYYWNLEGSPGPPAIDPVVETTVIFSRLNLKREDQVRYVRVCPGTPMYFTSLQLARRISTVTSLSDIQLSQYRIVSSDLGAAGYGVMVGR